MSAPNLLTNTTLTGDVAGQAVAASATAIVSNSSSSGKFYRVVHLVVANIHASSSGTITADVYDGTNTYRIINALPVAINSAITIVDRNRPVFLKEGWSLRLTADATSKFEASAHTEIWS